MKAIFNKRPKLPRLGRKKPCTSSLFEIAFQKGAELTPRSLDELPLGQPARVVLVRGGGGLAVRLMEMGLTPGAAIMVIKRAPFGDPLEVRVRDFHISLRKADAARVTVESK